MKALFILQRKNWVTTNNSSDHTHDLNAYRGPSWSWSYGSWIYNYLCNQCLSPQMLWVWIPLKRVVLDTTLYDKYVSDFAAGRRFSPGTPVSSTNKTDCHNTLYNLNIVESGIKHHNPTPSKCLWYIYCLYKTCICLHSWNKIWQMKLENNILLSTIHC